MFAHSPRGCWLPRLVALLAAVGLLAAAVLLWTGPSSNSPVRNAAAFAGTAPRVVRAVQAQTATQRADDASRNNKPPVMTTASTLPPENPSAPHTVVVPNSEPAAPSGSNSDPPPSTPAGKPPAESPDDERYRTAILGTWTQDSSGHRVLNVKQDGSATIDVTLDGLSALAFGEKLRFDIQWAIENGRLVFQTTGGKPEESVKSITAIYGARRTYVIRDITEAKMLLEENGQPKTDWDRVGVAIISGSTSSAK